MKVAKMHNSFRINQYYTKNAFTIVELLVVIVVIGILAAITIVSYTGLSSKATLASLQSDLSNSSKQLKIFQTVNGNYPATISLNCSTTPDTITNKCLKLSSGNTITSLTNDYFVNNNTIPQTFSLTIKNSSTNIISLVTESSKPSILVPAPLNPVADWIAVPRDGNNTNYDHYGNYYDTVSKTYATVSRATTKTIYDPNTQHIYDVPANKLAINTRSDGKSGYEGVVEEGRTNYLTNSDGESALGKPAWYNNNWGGSTASVTQDTSSRVYGLNSVKFTTTNWVDNSFSLNVWNNNLTASIPMTNGVTYTFSIWGKVLSGSATYEMDFQDDNGTTQQPITLTSSWKRFSVTRTLGAGVTNIVLRVYAMGSNQSSLWDAAQVESGPFETSYIPTTTTTVTRNADVITIPTTNWSSNNGTAFGVAGSAPGVDHILLGWGTGGAQRLFMEQWSTFSIMSTQGSVGRLSANTTRIGSGTHVFTGSWFTGGTLYSYYDGGSKASSGSGANDLGSMPASAKLGSYYDGSYVYDGSIQRLIIYSSQFSDSDVSTVNNAIKDGP